MKIGKNTERWQFNGFQDGGRPTHGFLKIQNFDRR